MNNETYIVLTTTQMKNKVLVRSFESAGYRVIQNTQMPYVKPKQFYYWKDKSYESK
jgi:hypothetical protein